MHQRVGKRVKISTSFQIIYKFYKKNYTQLSFLTFYVLTEAISSFD